jgi:hypothetical protein
MRIWDLSPSRLCRQHLLGEHRELHAVWTVITKDKAGYAHHPETLRWKGKLRALYARHQRLAAEMRRRGYSHASPLDPSLASGRSTQDAFVDPPRRQEELLRSKGCDCQV